MFEIIFNDGRIYKAKGKFDTATSGLMSADENNETFIGIETDGIRRLIRTNDIKEIVEVRESVTNPIINITINEAHAINIDESTSEIADSLKRTIEK